jgi:hypothetical protein
MEPATSALNSSSSKKQRQQQQTPRKNKKKKNKVAPSTTHVAAKGEEKQEDEEEQQQQQQRWVWLLYTILYAVETVSAAQFVHEWRTLPGFCLLLALCAHTLNAVMRLLSNGSGRYAFTNAAVQSVTIPLVVLVPFDFAERFELNTVFLLIRQEIVLLGVALLVIVGVYDALTTRWPATRAQRARFTTFARFVSEVVLVFICLGVGLLLWLAVHWQLLVVGSLALLVVLVFQEVYLEAGRIIFFFCLLYTELYLRVPDFRLRS